MTQFKQHLSQLGFAVFLDLDNMEGHLATTMRDNLNNSDIVFVIATPYFKKRIEQTIAPGRTPNAAQFEQNCILEGKTRKVVPLLLEGNFDNAFPQYVPVSSTEQKSLFYKDNFVYDMTSNDIFKSFAGNLDIFDRVENLRVHEMEEEADIQYVLQNKLISDCESAVRRLLASHAIDTGAHIAQPNLDFQYSEERSSTLSL